MDAIEKLKWNVYNKNFKSIDKFKYSCYKFKFNISNQKIQQQFVEFLDSHKLLLPWDICNFFIKHNIKYSINFVYCKQLSFKDNFILLRCVLNLKWKKFLYDIDCLKFQCSIGKKLINGKNRNSIFISLGHKITKTLYFIQMDSNIWWKPKKICNNDDNFTGISFGWLFIQFGKVKYAINK